MKDVFIGIPNTGFIKSELLLFLQKIGVAMEDRPIASCRNRLRKRFLESDSDYLLMIDSDIVPPDNILELVNYDKDIISAKTFYFHKEEIKVNAFDNNGKHIQVPKSGLVKVDMVSTGCLMIKRKVLEKITFKDMFDEHGIRYLAEDLNFCKEARKNGFEVFIHLDYPCSHFTMVDLMKLYETNN